jgi:hypothetical protein
VGRGTVSPGRAPPMDTDLDIICKGIIITGAQSAAAPAVRP